MMRRTFFHWALALASCLTMTACGVSEKAQRPTAAQLDALREYVYPLRTVVPDGGDNSDLEVLKTLLADAQIVGLGEATHGTREIFQMKDRLAHYLVQEMDFDIFSIEAAMPESYEVNRYTVGGEGEAVQWIKGMYFWTWSTEEVREMVEWMRNHNDGEPKIAFTGFDMQDIRGACRALAVHFEADETVRPMIDTLREQLKERMFPVSGQWPKHLRRREKHDFEETVARLRDAMNLAAFPDSTRVWLAQNLRILEQFIDYSSSLTGKLRDRYMAENLAWIQQQNPDSKIAAWAHNSHIKNQRYFMGNHLKERYGDRYTTIGFALGEGTYTAFVRGRGLASNNVLSAPPLRSYESVFSQLGEEIFLLDLKRIKAENREDMKWFDRNCPFGSIGSTATKNRFLRTKLTDDFDYLIFIRNSTSSRLLPR
jgi:erythromycin esterase